MPPRERSSAERSFTPPAAELMPTSASTTCWTPPANAHGHPASGSLCMPSSPSRVFRSSAEGRGRASGPGQPSARLTLSAPGGKVSFFPPLGCSSSWAFLPRGLPPHPGLPPARPGLTATAQGNESSLFFFGILFSFWVSFRGEGRRGGEGPAASAPRYAPRGGHCRCLPHLLSLPLLPDLCSSRPPRALPVLYLTGLRV